jgi:Trypsin
VVNDLAIVSIGEDAAVNPAPIVLSRAPRSGDSITIFGYGRDNQGKLGSLRFGEMTLSEVTENLLFARFSGKSANSCNGDSGGPAFFSFESEGQIESGIVGIISAGTATTATCAKGETSLFTNLQSPSALDFMSSIAPQFVAR